MSQFILNRQQVREVDRRAIDELGMPGLLLMENAGRGCVDVLRSHNVRGPVLIACGKGNNGGDGFVMARHLNNLGIETTVALACQAAELTGDAAANFHFLQYADVAVIDISAAQQVVNVENRLCDAEWVVDALLGTGATGPPRSPYRELIRRMNESSARRLAIDVPSGLDCDTGEAFEPTVVADDTCTFVAAKPGLLTDEAAAFVGTIHVIDIGVPRNIVHEIARKASL